MRWFSYGFLGVLVLLALGWSWNEPLLNSHAYRQTQTAQTIQIFLEEGWNPFLTKVRLFGKPGYTVLEFPLYQSLVAAVSATTSLPIEQAGRLISLLCALALAVAVATTVRRITERWTSDVEQSEIPHPLIMTMVMASPLIFATSQWITIELLNCALVAWAYVSFVKTLERDHNVRIANFIGFFLLCLFSLLLKPTALFASFPLFLFVAWRAVSDRTLGTGRGPVWKVLVPLFFALTVATLIAVAWFQYADHVNVKYGSGFGVRAIRDHLLLGDVKLYEPRVLAKLAGRMLVYVLGPGTLLLALWGVCRYWRTSLKARVFQRGSWLLACAGSILLYLAVFTGGNYFHSYYQLATVFPLYVGLCLLVPWRASAKSPLVLLLAAMMNIGVSGYQLLRQDRDCQAAMTFLKTKVTPGSEKPEVLMVSNWGAVYPILGYYVGRYGLAKDPNALDEGERLRISTWVAVGDTTVDTQWLTRLRSLGMPCGDVRSFGRLQVCVDENEPAS